MIHHQVTRREFARVMTGGALIAAVAKSGEADETPRQEASFSFGVIADAQFCDAEPAGTRYYRASSRKLARCVDTLNQEKLAFNIHLGDFIDRDFRSFDTLGPIYAKLKSPRYHVLGNHDFSVAQERLDDVAKKLGIPDRHYSFCSNGWRFIVLDGNDLSLGARQKGTPEYANAQSLYTSLKEQKAVNAQTWNGALGKAQLTWLDKQLDQADRQQEKVVVFCHFPVYPQNAHNLWNDREVIEIFESHRCVVAFMNGHNHAGLYGKKAGIHYLTFPGMVETADTTAYAVVRVHVDSLEVVGYGRTPNRRLKFP